MKHHIQISTGELIDKISILEIKLLKIKNKEKHKNVKKEYDILVESFCEYNCIKQYSSLLAVNKQLWDVEDKLRRFEEKKNFGAKFIELARKVYILNDKRASLKKEINLQEGSDLIEEKQYVKY